MAQQKAQSTITISDITDITDIYLQYCMVADNVTANNISENNWFVLSSDMTVQNKHYYTFNNSDNQYHVVTTIGSENPTSLGWYEDKSYPTWQSGYQIWIREARIKEGIDLPEYGTPYLDTAVNQINNNYINLSDKIKKIWSNSTGSYMASGINNNDVNVNDVSTYGYNSKSTTTGISFNYNAIPLIEMGILDSGNFSGIKLYSPVLTNSTISSSRLDATLTSWGLKLLRGGIESGSLSSGNGYVYLSTEDKTGITINGHNPGTNDPKWRAIIGSKFGVDAEGNLYAAGAHIDGDIIAQSLTIGSGVNAYSGIAAINISGYSIEIEVVDIAGSTNTKKLIPHLYHNGMNADSEVTDVTKFLWYIDNNMSVPGAAGLSPDGYIIGEYGHTYKVIYDFGDGVVGSGSAIQTRTVDPQKYITRIDANGITIHPETQNGNSSIRLDGTGLTIYDSNGAYLAKYGSTITLGNAENINNNFNIKITNTINTEDIIGNRGPGILLRKGTTVVNEITENGMKIYGLYVSPGSQVYNFGQLANFGGETKIGATNYTKINENEVGFYRNNNICLGKIDFTETIKNDCIYSFNHMWEDETQLTDTYTESIESYDGLGVTRVKGNFQYMTSSTNVLEEEEFDFDITQSSINTYTISDWFTMDIGVLSESWVAEGSLIQEVGYNATTDNTFSYFKINFIVYYDTYSEGPRYTFGKDVNSIGQYSFAMGNNTIAREDCQLTIGKFNVPTDDALFVIGNGTDDNNRSNLMEVGDNFIRIGLENDTRTEITPTSFLAVNAESVEGFKIEMDAPGLSYPVSITPEGPITTNNYVTETYGIAPLGQQLSVSDCKSEWATTKTVTSITNVSSNATANFDYSSGEYTVTLAKVDSNDYIFGTNKNETLSATVNFNDNTTQTIQFTISYSSPRTWTFQATATTSLLEFRIMIIPTVTYDLEVSTALTSGIRTYGSAKGAFSSVIGEELIATTEAHAAFGRYNNDTLVSPHHLIASFGKGKSELYRSNAAAIGFYNPDYHDEIASIYLSLDEAIWLSFMDEAPEPSNIDAEIIEALGNLGWINYDSTTQDFSNKSGSYMLADYSDRSNE